MRELLIARIGNKSGYVPNSTRAPYVAWKSTNAFISALRLVHFVRIGTFPLFTSLTLLLQEVGVEVNRFHKVSEKDRVIFYELVLGYYILVSN